jgi:hypothetical protein
VFVTREQLERELIEFAQMYQGYGRGETPTRPFAEFGVDLDMVMAEGARFARTRLSQVGYLDAGNGDIEREIAVGFTIGLGTGLRLGRMAR